MSGVLNSGGYEAIQRGSECIHTGSTWPCSCRKSFRLDDAMSTWRLSRPVYADGSSVQRWLEFGLLKADQTVWVEVFDN